MDTDDEEVIQVRRLLNRRNAMTDETDNTVTSSDLSSESTEGLTAFGGVTEMTKGSPFGWKIEGGINPWYF
jgi:hypothetical protein